MNEFQKKSFGRALDELWMGLSKLCSQSTVIERPTVTVTQRIIVVQILRTRSVSATVTVTIAASSSMSGKT